MTGSEKPGAPRPFVIESRHRESEVITSFLLRPLDGAPLPHIAGQYLTLFADVPGAGRQKRNFTISAAPNGATYRISVKREAGGGVSKWLHDQASDGTRLDIAPPAGDFVLPEGDARPLVMVSAGVGLTPMVAMLEALVAQRRQVAVEFVHCTQGNATQAFRDHVRELAAAQGKTEVTLFHTRPGAGEAVGRDYDVAGHLDLDWLAAHTPLAEAEFYVCGPSGFLRTFVPGLAKVGVAPERLHYEFFGPVEDLFDADGAGAPAAPAPVTQAPGSRTSLVLGGLTRAAIGDALLDSNADGLVVSDPEGRIVLWSPGAERIFGFSEPEALGQSLDIIIPEPFRARHWEGYSETVASGQSRYGAGDLLAVPGLTKDGRRISIEFTIVLMKDAAGTVTGMVAAIRDVTARFEETKKLKKRLAELEKPADATA